MHPALSALVVFIYNLRCSTSLKHHLNVPHLLGIRRNTVQGVMQEHRRSYEALLLQSALVLRSLAFCRGSLLLATLLSLLTCPVIACLNQLSSLIHVGSQGHAIFVEEALCLRLYSSKKIQVPPVCCVSTMQHSHCQRRHTNRHRSAHPYFHRCGDCHLSQCPPYAAANSQRLTGSSPAAFRRVHF